MIEKTKRSRSKARIRVDQDPTLPRMVEDLTNFISYRWDLNQPITGGSKNDKTGLYMNREHLPKSLQSLGHRGLDTLVWIAIEHKWIRFSRIGDKRQLKIASPYQRIEVKPIKSKRIELTSHSAWVKVGFRAGSEVTEYQFPIQDFGTIMEVCSMLKARKLDLFGS